MGNMKTALKITSNEVFEILEQKNVDVKLVTDILDCFIRNIEKEKQQIIDANNAGWKAHRHNSDQNAEDFYNETFK